MDFKKLWPSVAGLVGMVLAAFSDPILAWVTAHPIESVALSQVLTTIANLTKSPMQASE